MNVLLISRCSKNAIKETRRIIDQFALRKGTNTWQTPITLKGLETLRKALRKTARKNTAVACHWIRRKNHSELMWIVGDQSAFNDEGVVPTNYTYNDVLRSGDENNWNSLESIRLLTALAGLFHDAGKASIHFQNKLKKSAIIADPYRHEWVSLRIFQAFVAKRPDKEWLDDLANGDFSKVWSVSDELVKDGISPKSSSPFCKKMESIAALVGWLIVSHHRMPLPLEKDGDFESLKTKHLEILPRNIVARWNSGVNFKGDSIDLDDIWSFSGNPFESSEWQKQARRVSSRIISREDMFHSDWLNDTFAIHLARLSLVMADHYYSSLTERRERIHVLDDGLFANTKRNMENKSVLNQGLAEHLVGVAAKASLFLHQLPALRSHLPRITRHKGFIRRTSLKQYQWQNKCYDLAKTIGPRSAENGFFGINMASTGCGKTFANGRIMYGLGDSPQGVRFTYALGLRTLTLQTGKAYREMLSLGDDDLAVLVGGGAVRQLYEHHLEQGAEYNSSGKDDLLDENSHVLYEGTTETTGLAGWFDKNTRSKKLICAPITVCTIDHLMPATESLRGGHQIPPMLRLLTSDLILDEPDDFGLDDLHGLSRLVHWAGVLGSRVLLSSATMPPSFIEGLYEAYVAGRKIYRENCGEISEEASVYCGWFDEFSVISEEISSADEFQKAHNVFVDKRCKKISAKEQRKLGKVVPVLDVEDAADESPYGRMAVSILKYSETLHNSHHTVDSKSSKKVSFGLVRMANIEPLVKVAKELIRLNASPDTEIHFCCYHSRFPLLVRSAIEARLDRILKRADGNDVFKDKSVHAALKNSTATNHIFIILATSVAEVGRDHDYDWAIVEPSSMRSIIQLAGRILRHRKDKKCTEPNVYILQKNIKGLNGEKLAFIRPGFEEKGHKLKSHDLSEILTEEQFREINSLPRIKERDEPAPQTNLVDLEHAQIRDTMFTRERSEDDESCGADRWWKTRANLTCCLQKDKRFRAGEKNVRYVSILEEYDEDIQFLSYDDRGDLKPCDTLFQNGNFELDCDGSIRFWQGLDYHDVAKELAESLDMELGECTKIFGRFDLRESGEKKGWSYHPKLGFYSN